MLALLLSALLVSVPADSAESLDTCLQQAPSEAPPPLQWGPKVPQMWSSNRPVSLDTVRAALSRLQSARTCFLRLDPSRIEHPYLGNVMRTFWAESALLAALRRFSEANATFEEAHSFLESSSSIPTANEEIRSGWARALHQDRGILYYYLGDLSSAIDQYLNAYRSTPKDDVRWRVGHLLDVGILHQRMQDYQSAKYYYDRAARLFRESDRTRETHPSQWARLTHLRADLLLERTLNTEFDRGALRRARELVSQSLEVTSPGTEEHATYSLLLSETLGYLDHFEEAYRLNKEVRQYARANDAVRDHALSLLKLGTLHIQTGRWDAANSALTEALGHARGIGDLDYQRRILRALGRLYEIQADWSVAEDYYRKGVSVIEQYRESLTATEWSSTAFVQWRDVHRGLVRTLLAQERPRDALTALDRTRARHLQDLQTQSRVANELPAQVRARLDSISRALSNVRTQLGRDTLSSGDEAALRDREAALMTARQRILRRDATSFDRPTIDQIKTSLGQQNRALVSYFLDDPWPVYDRSPQSAAFILTADTLRTVSLPKLTQDSVQAQVTDISPLFSQPGTPENINAMHFDLRPLRTLHDRLYAPVGEHLPEGTPLTVIPDGPMFHVPYSMLATATPGGRYDHTQARFVLHERPTALDLATSMVVDTSAASMDPATVSPDLAAFGVSTFDTLRTAPSGLRAALPGTADDSSLTLSSLPGVRDEMNTLSRLFDDARTFLDDSATESKFVDACRRAGVLHLASHAFVHPSSPLQNAFLLRPDSTSDGVLFLHELRTQDRAIPLAVLSGCNTARGTLRGGEGMAGLQYAFRAMGTQSTVSNLWPTADQPSVRLMEAFYKNLRAGLPKDRALRQAKLTFLESHPNEASPFFWAPSVLYGSPQPVPLEKNASSLLWAWGPVALGGLAMLTALFLWRRPRVRASVRRLFAP